MATKAAYGHQLSMSSGSDQRPTLLSRPQERSKVKLTSLWGESLRERERERASLGVTGALAWQLTDIQMPRPRLVDRQTRDVKATEIFFLIKEFHFSENSIESQCATVRSLLRSPL